MILQTNLKHVETAEQYDSLLAEHEYVMICCGRMGPMCIPVYQAMIELESGHPLVAFRNAGGSWDCPLRSTIKAEKWLRPPQAYSPKNK